MSLEGFETVTYANNGYTASITKNGTTFGKETVNKLGAPNEVVLMINRSSKQFAIRAATNRDTIKMPFYIGGKKNISVRWNSKDFLKTIKELTGWTLENNTGYRVSGAYNGSEKAIVFDLNSAVKYK